MIDKDSLVPRVAPCKGCVKPNKHTIGCHSTCPEYLDFAEGRKLISKRRRSQQVLDERPRR